MRGFWDPKQSPSSSSPFANVLQSDCYRVTSSERAVRQRRPRQSVCRLTLLGVAQSAVLALFCASLVLGKLLRNPTRTESFLACRQSKRREVLSDRGSVVRLTPIAQLLSEVSALTRIERELYEEL